MTDDVVTVLVQSLGDEARTVDELTRIAWRGFSVPYVQEEVMERVHAEMRLRADHGAWREALTLDQQQRLDAAVVRRQRAYAALQYAQANGGARCERR